MDRRLWVGVGALIALLVIVRLLVGIFRRPAAPAAPVAARPPAAKTEEQLTNR